ncbi:MAG: 6-phosphofructokinase [Clostridiales bacterium]|nr:6-phosphofructokinase [Clostridiales bacterium]
MKTIGVLTSGGDCPGMNACVRAVVRCAATRGMKVYGINRGYQGMLEGDMELFDPIAVSGLMGNGGTVLRTARCIEFKYPEGRKKAADKLKEFGIEGVIVCGGDGSFAGAKALCEEQNIPCIGIPCTIDNDLNYTDFTLGFDTAVNTAIDCMHNVVDTMTSHERVCIVEVMGRNCGDIALYSGIASGADGIIIPEMPYDLEELAQRIKNTRKMGKESNLIVLAEGCGHAHAYVAQFERLLPEYSVRGTNLGYLLRGGDPSMYDRVFAARAAIRAVELLEQGIGNRVVGIRNSQIIDLDIFEALNMPKKDNRELYSVFHQLVLG